MSESELEEIGHHSQNKNVVLSIRVSPEEKMTYSALAAIRGISISAFIRELLEDERARHVKLSFCNEKKRKKNGNDKKYL